MKGGGSGSPSSRRRAPLGVDDNGGRGQRPTKTRTKASLDATIARIFSGEGDGGAAGAGKNGDGSSGGRRRGDNEGTVNAPGPLGDPEKPNVVSIYGLRYDFANPGRQYVAPRNTRDSSIDILRNTDGICEELAER